MYFMRCSIMGKPYGEDLDEVEQEKIAKENSDFKVVTEDEENQEGSVSEVFFYCVSHPITPSSALPYIFFSLA